MFDKNNINGYKLDKTIYNKENDINIYLLTHEKTEAKIVLMDASDINRSFNIAFRTPVRNSKGIPHILEHSVLCGSEKYDVKDPFIELVKGSLNTFLNAMTGNDVTFYPVASTNEKDFKNLVDVYLDSVFFPKCKTDKKIFMQEGWHYEINDNELNVNGIVLNEMRGDLSSESSIINYNVLENLYKGTNNEYVSGGDPKEIINLSYEEFCKFHDDYYNPTNSIIYFYGDLNMNEMLIYLDKEYLSKFEKREVAKYDMPLDFEKDRVTTSYYNVEKKEEKQTHIAINYILDYKRSTLYHLVIKMLDYMLFASDSAIIKEKFIKEGICVDVDSLVEEGLLKGFYSIVFKNTNDDTCDRIKKIFDEEIKKIIENGIPKSKLESTINNCYFHYVEDETSIPKGLEMIFSSLNSYIYGEDVDIFIKYLDAFDLIRKENLDSKDNIFIKVLKEVFFDNKKRGIGIIKSKENLVLENEKKLIEELDKRKKELSEKDIERIKKEDEELKEYQNLVESDEKLSKIPKISISDIDKVRNHNTYEIYDIGGKKTIITKDKTKNLTYIRLNFNIDNLSFEEMYMVALFSDLITKISLKDVSYEDLESKIDHVSGGITTTIEVYENKSYFTMTAKFLNDKFDENLELMNSLLYENDFSNKSKDRIKSIIETLFIEAKNNFMFKGHMTAINRSLSKLSKRHRILDIILSYGIAYNKFINKLNDVYNDNSDKINEYIDNLYKKIINKDNLIVDALVDYENFDELKNKLDVFIKNLKNNDYNNLSVNDLFEFDKYERKDSKEAYIVSGDVNFVARGGTYEKNMYDGHLTVLSTILNREYLWNNIRVLGGAYGAFAYLARGGVGVYASYRDPNLSKSDATYRNTVNFVEKLDFSQEKIDKFIIGSISTIDYPLSKRNTHKRNVTNYINEIDDKEIDKIRSEILNTNLDNLKSHLKNIKEIDEKDELFAIISSKNKKEAMEYYGNVETL